MNVSSHPANHPMLESAWMSAHTMMASMATQATTSARHPLTHPLGSSPASPASHSSLDGCVPPVDLDLNLVHLLHALSQPSDDGNRH